MNNPPFSTCRRIRIATLLLLLLFALTSWAQGATGNTNPITIQATWSFPQNADIDNMTGMWFAGNDSNGKHALALTWTPQATGWFPTWRLALVSDTGLLPATAQVKDAPPDWQGSVGIDLGTPMPLPGHSYEFLISYDAQNGALSLHLKDATTGQLLRSGGFTIDKSAGPFSIASDLFPGLSTGRVATISSLSTSPHYVPADTVWQVGEPGVEVLIPYTSFNPSDSVVLELKTAGTAPRGHYRVLHSANGKPARELPIQPQLNGIVALPTSDMPLGRSQLILEYSQDEKVTFIDTLDIRLGRIDIGFSDVKINRSAGTINSVMVLSSKSLVTGINAAVEASVVELVWDASAHNYRKEVYKKAVFDIGQNLHIGSGSQAVEFPVEMALPKRVGLWTVEFKPIVSPDITVSTHQYAGMFNTYTAPYIASNEAYTIAVLPDTQYLSGYNPLILNRMTHWLIQEADTRNIGLMLHVGDITDNNSDAHWYNAQQAISQLDGIIPYAMALGNHDMSDPGNGGNVANRGVSQIKRYFPPEVFSGLQGSYPEGRLDNTYHTFNVAGVDYLIVALEFTPPDDALAWANKVVESFPNHKVIVITHAYLSSNGNRMRQGSSSSYPLSQDISTTMNDGENIWRKFAQNHANIFMVISGHIGITGIPWHISKGVKGNTVYEFLIDYQDRTDGWLALLEFTPDNKLGISVYSPYRERYNTAKTNYGFTNRFQLDFSTGRISYNF